MLLSPLGFRRALREARRLFWRAYRLPNRRSRGGISSSNGSFSESVTFKTNPFFSGFPVVVVEVVFAAAMEAFQKVLLLRLTCF